MLTVRSLTALNSLTQPTRARTSQSITRLASPMSEKSRLFVQVHISTHCFYSKSLRIQAHPGMTSFTPPVPLPIWGFYCDICDCHILPTHMWTPALMSAPTHALRRKVLSLTKPKDKIYKTKNDNIKKSFRNYTTNLVNILSIIWIFN